MDVPKLADPTVILNGLVEITIFKAGGFNGLDSVTVIVSAAMNVMVLNASTGLKYIDNTFIESGTYLPHLGERACSRPIPLDKYFDR
jgi:hypothetical protein